MSTIILNKTITLISILVGVICYKRLQPQWLRLFFYFLVFTFIIDAGGSMYSYYFKKSNHFIVNIYLAISFIFYFFLFYINAERKKIKKIVLISCILYFLIALYDNIFINGFYLFNAYSYSVGSILITLCCMLYFMGLFTSDTLINYFKIPMFWIATGLLFYYAGNLVQMSLLIYILNHNLDPGAMVYRFISVTLNILLFGAFSVSFLCNQSWKKIR